MIFLKTDSGNIKPASEGMLSIESRNVFSILREWLYTEQDIVFRELISNGLDAISKREILEAETGKLFSGEITIRLDETARQLIFTDNGVGMTFEEVDKYINKIAFSGAEEFIQQEKKNGDSNIIGHFGVGFYSSFMYASHVAIETLSCRSEAPPVRWDCTGDMAFSMKDGKKKERGTSVILNLEEDNKFLQKPELIFEAVKKYFPFAKTPICFEAEGYDHVLVNDPQPVWKKTSGKTDTAEMNTFYKEYFSDSHDPLFWLQFESLDLGVRGTLFFRNTKRGTEELDGKIRIFNRGVYIGENIPEMIPKYIKLQNGIIECDNLQLAVSRSSVREDNSENEMLGLVFECLTQEVTIAFNDMFAKERDLYEERWPELNAFVKYGVMQDKTFASVMSRKIIFRDLYGKYYTLNEYLQNEKKLYYASDRLEQAHYIEIFKKFGLNALLFDHVLDQPLLMRYEVLFPDVEFTRIDSNISGIFEKFYTAEEAPQISEITSRFEEVLDAQIENITLKFVKLAQKDLSTLLISDEQARRMTEMMEIYGLIDPEDYAQKEKQIRRSLVINLENPMIQFIAQADKEDKMMSVAVQQLFDLALMSQQALAPENVVKFISRSEDILQKMLMQDK